MRESPYLYPGTNTLKNKLGIKDPQKLHDAERAISSVKAADITSSITGNFSLEHLKSIHKHLFDEIYEWAGELRTVDISKGNMFCRSQYITTQFDDLFKTMKKDGFLKNNTNIENVSEKLSFYLSELNAIHPFREGNGRTQRIFCQQLCLNTNEFHLNFDNVSQEQMIEASIDSFNCNYSKMNKLIMDCLVPDIQKEMKNIHELNLEDNTKTINFKPKELEIPGMKYEPDNDFEI